MIAISVSFRMKPQSVAKLTKALGQELHPALRKKRGFRGQFAFIDRDGGEALVVSVWDEEVNGACEKMAFPMQVALAPVTLGPPKIEIFSLSDPKFQQSETFRWAIKKAGEGADVSIFEVPRATLYQLARPTPG